MSTESPTPEMSYVDLLNIDQLFVRHDLRWLIFFAEGECRNPEWCDRAIDGLEQAIADSEGWSYTGNAISLEHDPTSGQVSAAFHFDDEEVSTASATWYLRILKERRERIEKDRSA